MNENKETRQEVCTLGMLCHLTAFAGHIIPLGNVIGPLIVWLMKKDDYPYVDDQGKESLIVQSAVLVYIIMSDVFAFITCGLGAIVTLAVGIFSTVMIIIAAIKASEGEYYRYPLSIPFIS